MSDFKFKQFSIEQNLCAMKVGTDGVLLGAWAAGGNHILDIGTGTGLIAIMMAQRFVKAQVTAIDIDHNAYLQSAINIENCAYKSRIKALETSLQTFVGEQKYDCIVSNPPFFINSLKAPDKARNTARHTDTLSYADLFDGVSHLLSDYGEFSTIIPAENLNSFLAESSIFGLFVKRQYAVHTTVNKLAKRYLMSFSKQYIEAVDTQDVILTDSYGERSEWYMHLTNDFYLSK